MRLAAQIKGGFYPAHPEAIAHVGSFLVPPTDERFTIFDPCAGEGEAIGQLASILECPQEAVHAIELDEYRADRLKHALPDGKLLAPADFFGCRVMTGGFSFLWLNPPFDDSYGGARTEYEFLSRCTDWLMRGGVLAFVCPEHVVGLGSRVRQHLGVFYENIAIHPFAENCRPFREVAVLAHKRRRPIVRHTTVAQRWEAAGAPDEFKYTIPPGDGPRVFEKVEPTEVELHRMIENSPLASRLKAIPEPPLPSPPLPLGTGHIALLLASGHLNGAVRPPNGPVHVVRGLARKSTVVSDVSDTENDDGSTSTRTTLTERIDLIIRTVDREGQIQTLGDSEVDAMVPIPAA